MPSFAVQNQNLTNMKKFLTFIIALCLAYGTQAATIVVNSDIMTNTTWTNNNIYILDTFIYVKNNATLTIEEGTLIKGNKARKGTLIVTRNGKIQAAGTPTKPIVFTSNEDPGFRASGDWGGVIILGKAPTNATYNSTAGLGSVEGGVNNANDDGLFGDGANSDPNHNSGVFKYVRIEFPGIAFQPDNEINGLTLGGVGKGTELHHIQVSYSGDDSYEFFGGTVDATHLIALAGVDDDFDCDDGYNGNIQYGIVVRDPNIADVSGSNAFEHDNDKNSPNITPVTAPTFSNITVIGPKVNGTPHADFLHALHLRRGTQTGVFNSVFVGWADGLYIDGSDCENNASNGSLAMRNTYLVNMGNEVLPGSSLNTAAWFGTTGWGNDSTKTTADCQFVNTSVNSPDLHLQSSSVLINKASFTHPRLNNTFFDNTINFVGALGVTNDAGWNTTSGWQNWDPQTTDYSVPLSINHVESTIVHSSVYPNPATENIHVLFELKSATDMNIRIVDMYGRVLQDVPYKGIAGGNTETLSVRSLANGMYFVQFDLNGESNQVLKFNVLK